MGVSRRPHRRRDPAAHVSAGRSGEHQRADRGRKRKKPVRRRDGSGAGGRVPTHPWRHIGFKPSSAGGGTKLDVLLITNTLRSLRVNDKHDRDVSQSYLPTDGVLYRKSEKFFRGPRFRRRTAGWR